MNTTGISRILSWATTLSLLVSFSAATHTETNAQTLMQSPRSTPANADGASHGIMLGDSIKLGDGNLCGDSANAEAPSVLVNSADKSLAN